MMLQYKAGELVGAQQAQRAARKARLLYDLAVEESGADSAEARTASEALAEADATAAILAALPPAFVGALEGLMEKYGVLRVEARMGGVA